MNFTFNILWVNIIIVYFKHIELTKHIIITGLRPYTSLIPPRIGDEANCKNENNEPNIPKLNKHGLYNDL